MRGWPIEVSPVEAGNADGYDEITSDAMTLVGLPDSVAVPCMTLPWQIAQKIHACTDPVEKPRSNDRAHDLVDLQLLEALMVDEPQRRDTERLRCGLRRSWQTRLAPNCRCAPLTPTTNGSG